MRNNPCIITEWTTFSNLESLRSKLKNAQVEETVTNGHIIDIKSTSSESFTESRKTKSKTSMDLIAGRLNTGPINTLSNQDCNRNIQPDSLLQTYRVALLNDPFSVPTSHQYTGRNVQSGNQTEETLKPNVYMYSLEGKTTKRMKQSDTFCNPSRANNSVHIQDPNSVTSDHLFQRRMCASVKETEVSQGSKNATDSLPFSKSSLQKKVDCTLPLSNDGSENPVLSRKTDVECLAGDYVLNSAILNGCSKL
ncbi:hypothetical protein BKA69DRAFT_665219 [Paraphysoderma sedebokerense]|nr:hypothetical protein BKA69DRAFT_665219 [Paraphysoderma sedebokerense]